MEQGDQEPTIITRKIGPMIFQTKKQKRDIPSFFSSCKIVEPDDLTTLQPPTCAKIQITREKAPFLFPLPMETPHEVPIIPSPKLPTTKELPVVEKSVLDEPNVVQALEELENSLLNCVSTILSYLTVPSPAQHVSLQSRITEIVKPFSKMKKRSLRGISLKIPVLVSEFQDNINLFAYEKLPVTAQFTPPASSFEIDELVEAYVQHHHQSQPQKSQTVHEKLETYAQAVLWDLKRKRIISADRFESMESIHLGFIRSEVMKHYRQIQVAHSQALQIDSIQHDARTFQELLWLHVLRVLWEIPDTETMLDLILGSATYQKILFPYQYLLQDLVPKKATTTETIASTPTSFKLETTKLMTMSVHIICSGALLEQFELLKQLNVEYNVELIERDIAAPIDFVLDSQTGAVIVPIDVILQEGSMRELVYDLGTQSIQYDMVWIIVDLSTRLDSTWNKKKDTVSFSTVIPPQSSQDRALKLFYGAIEALPLDIHVLFNFRRKDLGMWLRHAIDTTSVLVARNGTLPAEWFDRPYLLHDESQHERFLVSTGTVNAISAQLLMYQTSLQHLFVNPPFNTPEPLLQVLRQTHRFISTPQDLSVESPTATADH